jgi:hypothetical protein
MSTAEPIKFRRLQLEGWRQFAQIDVSLHPRLTVLTGRNGTGKSTLLNIFGAHLGYTRPYLATPVRDKSGGYEYAQGLLTWFRRLFGTKDNQQQIGMVSYTDGTSSAVMIPAQQAIQYGLSLAPSKSIPGFHVSSHRRLPNYQRVAQIPTEPLVPRNAYNQFNAEMAGEFQGQMIGTTPTFRIKEALLSMAAFGPGNKFIARNEVLETTFDGFRDTLKKILPEEIGFIDLSIRSPDVVLVTRTGDFLIDAASGGLMALVDLAWQIYMFPSNAPGFVVTIDEPENHLHPSMQRTLMGNLMRTFPLVQFIVATHSPFIASAVKDASVYILDYEDRDDIKDRGEVPPRQTRFVHSRRLEDISRTGTASDVLRDVLGLETTYPTWVVEGIQGIISKYQGQTLTEKVLAELRKDLETQGYTYLYPDALEALAKK